MTGSYDVAVFSGATHISTELFGISLSTFLYASAIFGWGSLVCRRFLQIEDSWTEFVAARMAVGCFIFYLAFIVLATIGRLHPFGIAAVWIAGLALAAFEIPPIAAKLKETRKDIKNWPLGQRLLISVVCILAILQLLCGLTPLIFYDSQTYQLLAPVQFLRAGWLAPIPWNVPANGPMALQLTLGMSWIANSSGGPFKLLMALFGLLPLLGAATIGKELGTRAAIMAALFVVAYPEFWMQQTLGVVDLPVAGFLMFGAIWWIQALRQRDWRRTLLAGIAFGFVLGSRYQGLIMVSWILMAAMVCESFRDRKIIHDSIAKGAVVAAILVVMVTPWLVRNYSTYGNPVYPLLHGVFGGQDWSAGQAVILRTEVMGHDLTQVPLERILLSPVAALLMFPNNGLFGLVLLLGSLAAVMWKNYQTVRPFAVFGLGGLIIWGVMHPEPGVQLLRYNAGSLVLMLSCAGAVLASDRAKKIGGAYIGTALAFGSLWIGIVTLSNTIPVNRSITDSNMRSRIQRANFPAWKVAEFANTRLNALQDKILFIGETRGLWSNIPFIAPSAFNGPQLTALFSADVDAGTWTARLRALGITHVLICSSEWQRLAENYGYFRLPDSHLQRFQQWLHILPVAFDDHQGDVLLALR